MAHPTEPETRRSRRERAAATRSLPTRRDLREGAPRASATRTGHREHSTTDREPGSGVVRLPADVYARRRIAAVVGGLAVVVLVLAGVVGLTSMLSRSDAAPADPVAALLGDATTGAPGASEIPVPAQTGVAAQQPVTDEAADEAGGGESDAANEPGAADPCADPVFQQALASGSDADAIAAAGGAESFRSTIAAGAAPCVDLHEAGRTWVVVNKLNALDPIDYWPEPQARAEGVQRTSGGHMRADVAAALSQLVTAARGEGVGEIGVNSGFRSYDFQVSTHRSYVGQLGQANADLTSARPGHSEHQTGLAVDVVACSGGCGTIERFGGTVQSDWVAANAHRFGFIIRYGDGDTATTGYEYEPWHLRYIGTDLAALYAAGGYRTLEDFFGMPPAPDYAD